MLRYDEVLVRLLMREVLSIECCVLRGAAWCCVVLCGVAWCCVVLRVVVWCCVVLRSALRPACWVVRRAVL